MEVDPETGWGESQDRDQSARGVGRLGPSAPCQLLGCQMKIILMDIILIGELSLMSSSKSRLSVSFTYLGSLGGTATIRTVSAYCCSLQGAKESRKYATVAGRKSLPI
jgi:hypothetical protein